MPARLIVYADTNNNLTDDKILRFCGVVYGDPDDVDADGTPLSWVASNKGTFLPEGIYLNVEKSNAKNASLGSLPTMSSSTAASLPKRARAMTIIIMNSMITVRWLTL